MPPPKQKMIHDPDVINLAINEIANKTGTLREIARKYGIPKSTLHFKMKNPGHRASFGPPPVLTNDEEDALEKWIIMLAKKGFPLKKEDLQNSVQKFLRDNPRPNSFKDNYPGPAWVRGFLKRHPAIATRTSEGVTHSSACVSESDIRKWFSDIHNYLEENNLLDALNDSRRVFNGDESGFQLCPKTGKVLAARGSKNVYTIDSNNSKECITVMFTFSADGQTCPPMVVYNYQRIPQKVAESVPADWGVGRSESGWMTSELFFEYIANVFHPYLMKRGIPMPVIYFLDGHKTHLTYEVSKLCKALNIELIALYPNATRILQPADVAVFKPVKAAWKQASRMWLMENPNEIITKVNFAKVLEIALKTAIKPETLINGFKACGLMPFNPNSVDYSKCLATNRERDQENVEPVASENVITLSKFIDLVGPTKIEQLRTCENVSEQDDNFKLLHKLYKTLDCTSFPFENSFRRPSIPEMNEITHVQASQGEDYRFLEDSLDLLPSNLNVPVSFPIVESEVAERLSNTEIPSTPHSLEQSSLEDRMPFCDSNHSQEVTTPLSNVLNIRYSEATEIDINEKTPSKPTGNDNIENSPAFKIISNTLLGTYLTLPKTPERKGKRNTLKMPFVVTSNSYRTMFKEQKEKKETELKEKEERKRLREETKLKKSYEKKEKIVTKEKNTQKKVAVTNACTICSKTTKSNNRVTCEMCSLLFHEKCVPKKHQKHVPEDLANDLFICHQCYKEDDNDETFNDEVMNYEVLEEDIDMEANLIFDLYKENKDF